MGKIKKVLLLEDDEMITEIYQKRFEKAGCQVLSADETKKALEIIQKEEPDVALLDLLIAGGGGIEILKNLKLLNWKGKTKFIIFSNNQDIDKEREAKNLGALAFLIKADYTPEKLFQELESNL